MKVNTLLGYNASPVGQKTQPGCLVMQIIIKFTRPTKAKGFGFND